MDRKASRLPMRWRMSTSSIFLFGCGNFLRLIFVLNINRTTSFLTPLHSLPLAAGRPFSRRQQLRPTDVPVVNGVHVPLTLRLASMMMPTYAEQALLSVSSSRPLLSIAKVFSECRDLPEGKHPDRSVSVHIRVQHTKQISPRLVFLRVCDHDLDIDNRGGDLDDNVMELVLRERDGFLSQDDIQQLMGTLPQEPPDDSSSIPITAAAAAAAAATTTATTTWQCECFPERLSHFDGPSFFPKLQSNPQSPICLHVKAVTVMDTGTNYDKVFLRVAREPSKSTTKAQRTDETQEMKPRQQHVATTKRPSSLPGRLPVLASIPHSTKDRYGGRNRDRGGIFAAWVLETFGLENYKTEHGSKKKNPFILDIAGGSGQLAFQLGVRRGWNITVVDPRPLKLSKDQQRTLQYHRDFELRLLPPGRNSSIPVSEYGHHFATTSSTITTGSSTTTTRNETMQEHGSSFDETTTTIIQNDQTWLVGGDAQVRHVVRWFDDNFTTENNTIWQDATIVLGMHPDEATEDLVDLALRDGKPFAVVPCCVFWRRDPHRQVRGQPVRKWEQFCDYLLAKDPDRIQVASLPFPGRNVVLYSLGE